MSEPVRHIAHFDLDAFFVEVEVLKDPTLRGRPLIVGGSRERGVVTTCSYEARAFGVRSAMPMGQALQRCPQAVVLPGSRGDYSRYSRWVTDIIGDSAPCFEKASIDEFYVDLTGLDRFHDVLGWTVALRERIRRETGLPISFGLAANKLVAKMATNEAKPNGYLHIPQGREGEFLAPLPVGRMPGIGDHAERRLRELGITTLGELAAYPTPVLASTLGRWAAELQRRAAGHHEGAVQPYHVAKSVSTENTFSTDTADMAFLQAELVRMTEKVAAQLRARNLMAGCIAVKLRNPDFETTSKQLSIAYTCYDDELIPLSRDLFRKLHPPGTPVRLLGVRLSELTGQARQTNLFSDPARKQGLYRAIDAVRARFGSDALTRGGALHGDK
jgi:DNA polymerase-4